MVRVRSGATREELLRAVTGVPTQSNPTMDAVGQQIGDHPAPLINLAGEWARIELTCPANMGVVTGWNLRVVPLAAGTMRILVDLDAGTYTEAYNARTATSTRTFAAAINQVAPVACLAMYTPQAGDCLGINVQYAAAGNGDIATNCHVLGAIVSWG